MNALVTGASSGVGFATAQALLARGVDVVLVSRDPGRASKAVRKLRKQVPGTPAFELADLASFDSVRELADRVEARVSHLDLIVNNAGIFRMGKGVSADGFELTTAVNHLSHFLLTRLLQPLWENRPATIINVSSDGHRGGDLARAPLESILRGERGYRGVRAYGDSKLANILFTQELRRRFSGTGLRAASVHPGVIATRIWWRYWDPLSLFMRLFTPFMGRPSRGAAAVMNAVDTAAAEGDLPLYFDKRKPAQPSDQALDTELAGELWAISERITHPDRRQGADAGG